MITVPAKRGSSTPTHHKGYNYLLVVEGKVIAHFTDAKKHTKKFDLSVGDAVAFDTTLKHYIEAADAAAKVAVARPTWGAEPSPIEE